MTPFLPTVAEMDRAVITKDPVYEGLFVIGVKTGR